MKTFPFIILAFIFLTSGVFGQSEVLVLTKIKNNKQKIVKEGKRIKVHTVHGYNLHGDFQILDDKHIAIGRDTLALFEIDKIKVKSRESIIIGGVLTGGGVATIIGGSVMLYQTKTMDEWTALFPTIFGILLIGAGVLPIGPGVLLLLIGHQYKREKWKYSILTLKPALSKPFPG
jgi:hypothetical protein